MGDVQSACRAQRGRNVEDPNTLHSAVCRGDKQMVQASENVATANGCDGRPLLHCAVWCRQLEIAKYLVEEVGTPVDIRCKHNWTPLMVASSQGYTELVQYFLTAGADVTAKASDGMTALHLAAEPRIGLNSEKARDMYDLVYKDHDTDSNEDMLYDEDSYETAIAAVDFIRAGFETGDYVIKRGLGLLRAEALRPKVEVMKLLVSAGADPTDKDSNGWTALHCAATYGNIDTLRYILELKRVPVDERDNSGCTPLMVAAKSYSCLERKPVFQTLVEAGADVNLRDSLGRSAVQLASLMKFKEAMTSLLEIGLQLSSAKKELAQTFLFAVESKDHKAVNILISSGVDVNCEDIMMRTPLHIAARVGDTQILDTLIKAGANVNAMNRDYETPLMHGIRHSQVVKRLVEAGADVNVADKCNRSAIFYALTNGGHFVPEEVFDILLAAGADINITHYFYHSFLPYAALRRPQVVKKIIDSRCYVDPEDEVATLIETSRKGNLELVNFLLSHGFSKKPNSSGFSALHAAAQNGHIKVVEALIKAGASVDVADSNGVTPLLAANTKDGYLKMLETLISYGADVTVRDGEGKTLLHRCCEVGSEEGLEYLLQSGLSLTLLDYSGNTVLHSATACHDTGEGVLERLLVEGAIQLNSKNNLGHTALALAVLRQVDASKNKRIELLLQAGADTEVSDINGKTVLHLAAGKGEIETMELLLAAGGNIQAKDNHNQTVLHTAAATWHYKMVDFLVNVSLRQTAGFCSQLLDERDADGKTALMMGVVNSCKITARNMTNSLLQAGASARIRDNCGKLALHYAIDSSNYNVSSMLLQSEPDSLEWLSQGYRNRLLGMATQGGDTEIMKQLISAGAEPAVRHVEDGRSGVHYSARSGNTEILHYVLDRGGQIDDCDREGRTVLHYSVGDYRRKYSKHLLEELSLSPDDRDEDGQTPLMLMASGHIDDSCRSALVRILLEAEANSDLMNNDGMTALKISRLKSHPNVIEILEKQKSSDRYLL